MGGGMSRSTPPIGPVDDVADFWESYSGDTAWVKALREFGRLGGQIQYWCGVPQSASAIPLTFGLFHPDGREIECDSRLKDIRAAIVLLREVTSHDLT